MKRILAIAVLCGSLTTSAWAAAFSNTTTDSVATVGSGGDYATLGAAATAFNAVSGGLQASWEIRILASTSETANVAFGNTVAASKTITIKPAAGTSPTLTFSSTTANNGSAFSGNLVIGCSVTASAASSSNMFATTNAWIIDGSNTVNGTERNMTFTSTGGASGDTHTIRIAGATQGVIVKNLVVNQTKTIASAGCVSPAAANISGLGDILPNNLTVSNCMLKTSSSGSGMCLRPATGAGTVTSGTAITGLIVEDCDMIFSSRAIDGVTLSGLTFRRNRAVLVNGGAGNCFVLNHSNNNSATGYTFTIEDNLFDVSMTSAPTAAQGPSVMELGLSTGTYNVRNNIINFNTVTATGTATDGLWRAINATSATSTYNIEHNTITMGSSANLVTGGTAGRVCAINSSTTRTSGALVLRNNIIKMGQAGTAVFMIRNSAGATGFTSVGNDLILGSGLPALGIVNTTTYTAFSDWQTAGFDINSTGGQSVDPSASWAALPDNRFISAPSGLGTVQSSTVTTDIDGQARPATGALPGADEYNSTADSYVWNVNGTGQFDAPGDWTPARSRRRVTDQLTINGASTSAAITMTTALLNSTAGTNVAAFDIPCGRLQLINSANVSLSALSGARNIYLYDQTGTELQVAAGATLKLTGANIVRIILNGTSTGTVGGDVIESSTATSIPHAIWVKTPGALVFQSGSTFAMAPGFSSGGNGFGVDNTASVAGGVVFQSGSTCYQGGTKDGTRSGASGSSPFGPSGANAIVVFDSGSTYVCLQNVPPSLSGRTYGNFIFKCDTSNTQTGSSTFVVQNNLEFRNSGVVAQGHLDLTATTQFTGAITVGGDFIMDAGGPSLNLNSAPSSTTVINIAGNVSIGDASLLTEPTNANHVWRLNGTSNQTVNFGGETLVNLTVSNSAGVTLTGNATVSGNLTLTAGEVNVNGNTLTVADGTSNVTRTSGFVRGALRRNIDATATGARLFPVGTTGAYSPVTVNITSAGTGTGTLTASATATDHASVVDASHTANRYWTLTPTVIDITGGGATLTFQYDDADIAGLIETNLTAARYTGTGTIWDVLGGTVTAGSNTIDVTGVTQFSDWTLGDQASALPVELDAFSIQ